MQIIDLEQYVNVNFPDVLLKIRRSKSVDVLPELTIYEKTIIFAYTDTSNNQHQALNDLLWLSKGTEISEFGLHLENCLAKLESFSGLVFRGVKEEYCDVELYINALNDTTLLTEYHFLSATKSQIIALGFGKILFRIYSKNAKSIEKVSKFEREQELIFKRGSSFKVIHVSNNGFYTIITLKEVRV